MLRYIGNAIAVVFCCFILFSLTGCGGSQTTPTSSTKQLPEISWQGDGVINPKEYSQKQTFGELTVYSRLDGEYACFGLQAPAKGWVALGFGAEGKMKNADIVIFTMRNGKLTGDDSFSAAPSGPHPTDLAQGGTNDILDLAGGEKDGLITIEFKRKLRTGDPHDKDLQPGSNNIIWALGSNFKLTSRHLQQGTGTLVLE
nr:DOMON domain-containing protein [uncultured Anaeromusa sp.]